MKTFAIILILALTTGCASITRGTTDALTVETVPSGAECSFSNGFYCASTPCTIKMKRRSEGVVTCNKEGYETGTGNFTHKTAGAGAAGMAGNVLIGGLIGAAIDAGTGSTQNLTPNPLTITLDEEGIVAKEEAEPDDDIQVADEPDADIQVADEPDADIQVADESDVDILVENEPDANILVEAEPDDDLTP